MTTSKHQKMIRQFTHPLQKKVRDARGGKEDRPPSTTYTGVIQHERAEAEDAKKDGEDRGI
jgi:hypothetical protein